MFGFLRAQKRQSATTVGQTASVRRISRLEALDAEITKAFKIASSEGYSRGVEYLDALRFVPVAALPDDPLSDAYRQAVLDLYVTISGRPGYEPEMFELANLTLDDALAKVWPFESKDAAVVGSYFMGVAHITRVLGLYEAKKVLEFGVGWGHTSMLMHDAGLDVTATDIEPVFLQRLNVLRPKLKTHRGRFGELPDDTSNYDAFVFFECFHHWLDFNEGIAKLSKRLNKNGKIILAGEPMLKADDPPWSLRMDGHAIWAIRTHGWMELGFREDFLISTFDRHGFDVTGHPCPAAGEAGMIYCFHLR